MAATPYSTQPVASITTDVFTTNAATATDTGTLTWNILDAAANAYLCYCYSANLTPAQTITSGQSWIIGVSVRCPTGPSVQLGLQLQVTTSGGTGLLILDSSPVTVDTNLTTLSIVTPTLPANAASIRILVMLKEGSGTSRTLAVGSVVARPAAQVDDVTSVSLERDLARTDDNNGSGGLVITQGPIGPRSGTIVYLCSSWDVVTQLDTLYRNGSATLDSMRPYIPSWTHYATGRITSATEKALPGMPSRWLVSVPVREAT